jgi:pyruvate kinase
MLESMTEHTRPTRAEATDVANAILDGSDALMLSGETAIGAHPVAAVHTVARIAEEVEAAGLPQREPERVVGRRWAPDADRRERLSTAAFELIAGLEPAIVVAATQSGMTARQIARFRIRPWLVALTTEETTCRQLLFTAGVHPVRIEATGPRFDETCRRVLGELGVERGIAVMLLPEEVSGDPGAQHLHIVEL